MSDSQSNKAASASRRRTRTGCITCRIRRVKCDETRPECKRCIQSKRKCDGYGPAQAARLSRRELTEAMRRLAAVGPASRILAGRPPQAGDVGACFDFFRIRTAPGAGAFLPSGFWDRRFLQLAHSEPAVWNAAAALGSLHRRWEVVTMVAPGGQGAEFAEQASQCYGEAMALAKSIRDPWTLLVLSLALAAVSNLSGRWVDSRVHLASGQRLLEFIKTQTGASAAEIEDIADSLMRMDLEGASFSEASAPHTYTNTDGFEPIMAARGPLSSLNQAAMRLLFLTREFMNITGQEPWVPGADDLEACRKRAASAEQLRFELLMWESSLKDYLERFNPVDFASHSTTLLWLKLHHAFACLLLMRGIGGPESKWDAFLAQFERVVALSSCLLHTTRTLVPSVVTLDPGLVMPLHMVVSRCRHPVIRRRALALLRRANRQEGAWHSIGSAAFGERLMLAEEEGLGVDIPPLVYLHASDIDHWGDEIYHEKIKDWLGGSHRWVAKASWDGTVVVPERQRCVDTIFAADFDAGHVHMTILYSGLDEYGCIRTGEAFVKF